MPLSTIEYSTSNIPAFLSKLWTLVEDKKYDELIAWDPVCCLFVSSHPHWRPSSAFLLPVKSPATASTCSIRRVSRAKSSRGSSNTTTWPASYASWTCVRGCLALGCANTSPSIGFFVERRLSQSQQHRTRQPEKREGRHGIPPSVFHPEQGALFGMHQAKSNCPSCPSPLDAIPFLTTAPQPLAIISVLYDNC